MITLIVLGIAVTVVTRSPPIGVTLTRAHMAPRTQPGWLHQVAFEMGVDQKPPRR
jgi:hypothetical protein